MKPAPPVFPDDPPPSPSRGNGQSFRPERTLPPNPADEIWLGWGEPDPALIELVSDPALAELRGCGVLRGSERIITVETSAEKVPNGLPLTGTIEGARKPSPGRKKRVQAACPRLVT